MDSQSRPEGGETEAGGQRELPKVSGDPRCQAKGSVSIIFFKAVVRWMGVSQPSRWFLCPGVAHAALRSGGPRGAEPPAGHSGLASPARPLLSLRDHNAASVMISPCGLSAKSAGVGVRASARRFP